MIMLIKVATKNAQLDTELHDKIRLLDNTLHCEEVRHTKVQG